LVQVFVFGRQLIATIVGKHAGMLEEGGEGQIDQCQLFPHPVRPVSRGQVLFDGNQACIQCFPDSLMLCIIRFEHQTTTVGLEGTVAVFDP